MTSSDSPTDAARAMPPRWYLRVPPREREGREYRRGRMSTDCGSGRRLKPRARPHGLRRPMGKTLNPRVRDVKWRHLQTEAHRAAADESEWVPLRCHGPSGLEMSPVR